MVWVSPAQWFQLCINTTQACRAPGRHWFPGAGATALHSRMPITWSESQALDIIGIQTCSLASFLKAAAEIPGKSPFSSKKFIFAWPLLLAQSLPGWYRGWRSEHPALCSCPQTIPWIRSHHDDGEALLVLLWPFNITSAGTRSG